jgi:hypothetical protein
VFGWDPFVGGWRVVLALPGPAGWPCVQRIGGEVLVDCVDGTQLEAIAETADGTPEGSVDESAVLLWRRLFGESTAGWLAGSAAPHVEWRFAPDGQPTPEEDLVRSALGRLALVERSLDSDSPSVFAIEGPQLAAAVQLAAGLRIEGAVESAELPDDEVLAFVSRTESLEPVRVALEAAGYTSDALLVPLRPPGSVVGGMVPPDRVCFVADRVRAAIERERAQAPSWFEPRRQPIFPVASSVRTTRPGDGVGFEMGLAAPHRVKRVVSPLTVALVDLPADRLVDWDAAIDGRSWAARVSFRGCSDPHLVADVVDSSGDLVAATPFTMESVGAWQIHLRAEGRLPESPPFDEFTVRVRGVDLDPEALDLASVRSDQRLHATSPAASAAGAGRWALAGAQVADGVALDSPAPPSVLDELSWIANRRRAAADAWSSCGVGVDDRWVRRCRQLAAAFDSAVDQLGSNGGSGDLEQLVGQLRVDWSERVARLLATALAAEWGRDPHDPVTPELAERSSRLAELIGDHVQADRRRAGAVRHGRGSRGRSSVNERQPRSGAATVGVTVSCSEFERMAGDDAVSSGSAGRISEGLSVRQVQVTERFRKFCPDEMAISRPNLDFMTSRAAEIDQLIDEIAPDAAGASVNSRQRKRRLRERSRAMLAGAGLGEFAANLPLPSEPRMGRAGGEER